jgi:hypothetical protein
MQFATALFGNSGPTPTRMRGISAFFLEMSGDTSSIRILLAQIA